MKTHTKGPWEYGTAKNYSGFYVAPKGTLPTLASVERCGDHKIQIHCFNFPGDTEANARLIAAAPQLLAVCKAAYAFLVEEISGANIILLDDLQDAIAEAEEGN